MALDHYNAQGDIHGDMTLGNCSDIGLTNRPIVTCDIGVSLNRQAISGPPGPLYTLHVHKT